MYPTRLEPNRKNVYYRESDCFGSDPRHLVHAYLHENCRIKLHVHQFYEMNVIVSGEGRHYIGDSSLPVRVGDVFIIPPHVAHGYFSHGRLDVLHVLLRADFMQRYREELGQLPAFALLFDIEPQIRRSSGRGYNLQIPPHLFANVREALTGIIRAEQAGQFVYQSVLTLGLIGSLGELLRQSIQEKTAFCEQGGELLRVMEFIGENLDQKLTLDSLAALARMSKSTLTRRFRELLHTSPMQYVLDCRLQRAKDLLARPNPPSKTEIAQLCGFFDIAHMNKYLHG